MYNECAVRIRLGCINDVSALNHLPRIRKSDIRVNKATVLSSYDVIDCYMHGIAYRSAPHNSLFSNRVSIIMPAPIIDESGSTSFSQTIVGISRLSSSLAGIVSLISGKAGTLFKINSAKVE